MKQNDYKLTCKIILALVLTACIVGLNLSIFLKDF